MQEKGRWLGGVARWEPPSTRVPTPRRSRTLHRGAHGGVRHGSEFAVERLVEEELPQFLQDGKFACVGAGVVLGCFS